MSAPLVYCIDDDPVAMSGLSELLGEETDCEVQTFTAAAAIREAAAERPPDAVIAGWRIAGEDGLALARALGAGDPDLVALIATSGSDPGAAAEARNRVGPLAHVEKPFEPTELVPKLRAGLERRGLVRALRELRADLEKRDQALSDSRLQARRTAAELASTHSELSTATERLVAAEQLAAVGRVVSGIAHEIDSQLALVGYAEAIKSRVAGDPELVEFADVIVTAQKRLAATVEQIRDFARGAARIEREPADLAAMVDEALAILRYDRDVRARTIARDYREKPLVALHREKFCQVVINLVTNAVQATDPGDTIAVALDVDRELGVADLAVSDPGSGMAPEVLARLGEPFFTTRGDRGSGLGVGICMRIVEEHGGSLTYCSELGGGTIARVRLPLLHGEG